MKRSPLPAPFGMVSRLAAATIGALVLGVPFQVPPNAAPSTERHVLTGGEIAIHNLAGELRVEAGTGDQVVVEVTRGGRHAGLLEVETTQRGARRILSVRYPGTTIIYPAMEGSWRTTLTINRDGSFGDHKGFDLLFGSGAARNITIKGKGTGTEAHADLRVLVPPRKKTAFYLAVGKATVTGVQGDVLMEVCAASVSARGTRGTLRLDTGSGEVRVTDAEGDVSLDTGSGSVVLSGVRGGQLTMGTGSGGVSGTNINVSQLNGDTGSGGIELENVRADQINLDSGSGHTKIGLLGDVSALNVDSGSGGVTILCPRQLGAEFDIETGSGGIDIDVPHQITERERHHVRGRIGDGRGSIQIESGSGGVRLLRSSAGGAQLGGGVGRFFGFRVE